MEMKVQGNTQLAVVKVGKCRCDTRAAVCVPCKKSLTKTDDIKMYVNVGSETHCRSVCIPCRTISISTSDLIVDLILKSFQQIGLKHSFEVNPVNNTFKKNQQMQTLHKC